jgi:SAM-dependent methyltransferase
MPIQIIVCPICRNHINIDTGSCVCDKGHKFKVINGIVDLMPSIKNDENLTSEEEVWDNVAEKGFGEIGLVPNQYIETKCWHDRLEVLRQIIKKEWPDYRGKDLRICEIGCGYRLALSFLLQLGFSRVDYIGVDISIKMMENAKKNIVNVPTDWNTQFIRSSANEGIFKENSLDIVFCDGVLARLELDSAIAWITEALRPDGLFIFNDHSDKNLLAKIGRRLIPNFHLRYDPHNEGQKCLLPDYVKERANRFHLRLVYEKGLHFANGRLQYLTEILNLPKFVMASAYHAARFIDYFFNSPSWSYSFVQAYKKDENRKGLPERIN